ncbi:MAG: hypothetical protein IPJ49_29175 [Candidatus Obscuribacter sp.]|nr:hypothetical protein [Candidatus Obscuribacter sp.]
MKETTSLIFSWVCTLITTGVAVFTSYSSSEATRDRIRLESEIARVESQLKQRAENRSDFTFVHSLMPDLLSKEPARQAVAVHLIRLALSKDEAQQFISDLNNSTQPALKSAGSTGLADLKQSRSKSDLAEDLENKGFDLIISGKIAEAAQTFKAADEHIPVLTMPMRLVEC